MRRRDRRVDARDAWLPDEVRISGTSSSTGATPGVPTDLCTDYGVRGA